MCLAIPGKILSIEESNELFRSGKVSFSGIVKEVHLSCVPDASVGDYVIVHAGFAISRLDEEEARVILDYLEAE
ncbi:HypC/HybG/HupF family hydrogenase formation chaperone [bacterium]|nr:HypC/HybG/HupF family hydrogenase formation chaperone [bacterium]MBU1651700.1 HypC/HybG/HupF family hydrogenase formation chaperone [bacterium]